MNRAYRIVWNAARQMWMVAAEKASGGGRPLKGVLQSAALLALLALPALLPAGQALAFTTDVNNMTVENETIGAGQTQNINSGGVTVNNMVSGEGAQQNVNNGGLATSSTISDFGIQYVNTGGTAGGTIINSNAQQNVKTGGTASNTILSGGGGQNVEFGGIASDTTISNGGWQYIHSGGKASSTTIDGGMQEVRSGGTATNTTINSGTQSVYGTVADSTVKDSGLVQVNQGGTARSTVITGGEQYVRAGGTATGTTVSNDGLEVVWGTADSTILNARGNQVVMAGGTATDTILRDGGTLRVSDGATATGVNQQTGGALAASTDATVVGTHASGDFSIRDGKAMNLLLENGGLLTVLDGHQAADTTVQNGGTLSAGNGSTFTGRTLIAAGGSLLGTSQYGILAVNHGDLVYSAPEEGEVLSLSLNGEGRLTVEGGTLTLENNLIHQNGGVHLQDGSVLTLTGSIVEADVTGSRDTRLDLKDSARLSGQVTSTGDMSVADGALWQVTEDSAVVSLTQAGTVSFGADTLRRTGSFAPVTLTLGSLQGEGGTFFLRTAVDDRLSDRLVIDGGAATGHSLLNIAAQGLGRATEGDGITVVELLNGGTSTTDAFSLANRVEAGAYNYNLRRSETGNWHLTTDREPDDLVGPPFPPSPPEPDGPVDPADPPSPPEPDAPVEPVDPPSPPSLPGPVNPDYRTGLSAYLSAPTAAAELDGLLADQAAEGRRQTSDRGLWWNATGGHLKHRGAGQLLAGDRTELSGTQTGLVMGSDVWRHDTDTYALWAGVYAGTGRTELDAWRNGGGVGTVKGTTWTGGAYLGGRHEGGTRAEVSVQGSHHRMSGRTDTGQGLSTDGRSWSVAAQAGHAFGLTEGVELEPHAGYRYQQTALDDARDGVSAVQWDTEGRSRVSAGLRLSGRPVQGNETGRLSRVSELPVSWYGDAVVERTMGAGSRMRVRSPNVEESRVSFHSDGNGTSGRLEAGVTAEIRPGAELGVGVNYSTRLAGNGTEGYGGGLKLKVGF